MASMLPANFCETSREFYRLLTTVKLCLYSCLYASAPKSFPKGLIHFDFLSSDYQISHLNFSAISRKLLAADKSENYFIL